MPRFHPRTARTLAALALAGSVGTVAAGVAGASGVGGYGDHDHGRHESVLKFTTETVQFAVVDVGPPGPAPSLGDEIVSSDTVFGGGKALGTDGVVCTVVRTGPRSMTCQWTMTMSLPQGQLAFQGIADGPAGPPTEALAFSLAVTGGTGAFQGAQGVADIVDNPGGREDITVRLAH